MVLYISHVGLPDISVIHDLEIRCHLFFRKVTQVIYTLNV